MTKTLKTPLELLIRLLVAGGRVDHGGHTYAMSEDGDMCVVATRNDTEVCLRVDFTLGDVNRLAEDIGRDELWLRCCALTLRGD